MGACFLGSVKKEKREREKLYGTKQGFFFETPSQISLRQRKRPVISREAGLKSDLEKKKKKVAFQGPGSFTGACYIHFNVSYTRAR